MSVDKVDKDYEGGDVEAAEVGLDDSDEDYSCLEKLLEPVQFTNTDSEGKTKCKFCFRDLTDKDKKAV